MTERSIFLATLDRLFAERTRAGASSLAVCAAELHRLACGQASLDPKLVNCCAAMRASMRPDDRILFEPPKGKSRTLSILYRLPRAATTP